MADWLEIYLYSINDEFPKKLVGLRKEKERKRITWTYQLHIYGNMADWKPWIYKESH